VCIRKQIKENKQVLQFNVFIRKQNTENKQVLQFNVFIGKQNTKQACAPVQCVQTNCRKQADAPVQFV
jgi:hypothetical protein